MVNAVEPDSPLPIHRHQKTSETVVCLRGRLVWEFYNEVEHICTERIELSPNGPIGIECAQRPMAHREGFGVGLRDIGDEGGGV